MRVSGQRPWSFYTVDESARRYGASPDEETQDADAVRALSEVGAVAISRRLAFKSLDLPPTT
jgi:hypothetical protein